MAMETEKLQLTHLVLQDLKSIIVEIRNSPLLIITISISFIFAWIIYWWFKDKDKKDQRRELIEATKIGDEYKAELANVLNAIKDFLNKFREEVLKKTNAG